MARRSKRSRSKNLEKAEEAPEVMESEQAESGMDVDDTTADEPIEEPEVNNEEAIVGTTEQTNDESEEKQSDAADEGEDVEMGTEPHAEPEPSAEDGGPLDTAEASPSSELEKEGTPDVENKEVDEDVNPEKSAELIAQEEAA